MGKILILLFATLLFGYFAACNYSPKYRKVFVFFIFITLCFAVIAVLEIVKYLN